MMKFKLACSVAALAAAALLSGGAKAGAIVFNLPDTIITFGPYSQDGYTFTNSYGSGSYLNWVENGVPRFNAAPAADIATEWSGTSNTITNDLGHAFVFTSIGLADGFNDGSGGDVQFTFNHVGGLSDSVTVTLANGVFGLQTFTFNETNLTNVVFTPTTTEYRLIQFDNVGVSTSVPEPSTWAMMLAGFAGLGFAGYRKSKVGREAFIAS
jgi:hypothetical protein